MSTANILSKVTSSSLLLAIIVIAAFFIVFIRWKKNSPKKNEQNSVASSGGANMNMVNEKLEEKKKLTPEELLNKAWEFLNIIAEKVLRMASTTQNEILEIGRKLKANGMVFTIMVEDGSSEVRRSPAKEKAAQESAKSNQQSQ